MTVFISLRLLSIFEYLRLSLTIFDYLWLSLTMRRDVAVKYLKAEKKKERDDKSVSQNWIITAYDRSHPKETEVKLWGSGGEKKVINSCAKLEKNLTEWSVLIDLKTEPMLSYIPERKIVKAWLKDWLIYCQWKLDRKR